MAGARLPIDAEAAVRAASAGRRLAPWGRRLSPVWRVIVAALALAAALAAAFMHDAVLRPAAIAHATLMVVAWGLLIPAGALLARYGKVTPGQDFPRVVHDLSWWRGHRLLQYSGIVLATVALVAIGADAGAAFTTLHARCGAVVMALGVAQVASGWLRGTAGGPWAAAADPDEPATWRGDHYDMTLRRRMFEAWHKSAGWAAIGLAGVTIPLGTGLAGAPDWLLLLVGVLQGAVALGFVDGAARGRRVSTYRALWGVDQGPRRRHRPRGGRRRSSRVDDCLS